MSVHRYRVVELQRILGNETERGEDHAHQTLLTNQRRELLWSCEHLVEKSAGHDAGNMKQILDQIRALHTSRTSILAPSEPSRLLSPLKNLTEQLKRGRQTTTSTTCLGPPAAGPLSPGLFGEVDLVLKELQSLNWKIDSNMQLLEPYITFLRMVQQLQDSFKDLKKCFSNLKFNYLKRNDRTRNTKAVQNQLQQVDQYEERLQMSPAPDLSLILPSKAVLRKRLQAVTARLGSEVRAGGVAREAEDAINELQRQMGDFERTVSEHQKTLEMSRRLQQAVAEYHCWCEEASATIAHVGKFSSKCRSTEAVSVLYQQFEKFVWPTVPEQEERISQISELAVRLHGLEEGQQFIEKMVSKHSEMVESIRELSDRLMELENTLKLENLRKQQNDREKDMKEETERWREKETEEKDEEKGEDKDGEENEEKEKKENREQQQQQRDDSSTQEAADLSKLKETGHPPEMTAEHDGKEVPRRLQPMGSLHYRRDAVRRTD